VTVDEGHRRVHEHDVGMKPFGHEHDFIPVAGIAHDHDPASQVPSHEIPEIDVAVGDQEAEWRALSQRRPSGVESRGQSRHDASRT
jgi:hypothetical protein